MPTPEPKPLSPNPLPDWQRRAGGLDAEGVDATPPPAAGVGGPFHRNDWGIPVLMTPPPPMQVFRLAPPPLTLPALLLRPGASLPSKSRPSDAGWDLHLCGDARVPAGATVKLATGLALAIPEGWYGQVRDRSGLAAEGLATGGGVIDCLYRGEIFVVMRNHGAKERAFKGGDRIAQLTLHEVPSVQVEAVEQLPETDRGSNGFGSSGR